MKALLLDIGNSRIKWGVLVDESIRQSGHIRQSAIRERGLAALTRRLPHDVDVVLACNVAGTSIETRLSAVIGLHCDCDVRFARAQAHAYGITNGYRQSRRLGVDRWVAMIGARTLCETSCIVVDAGTAITIDAMDDDGQHLGGQILPGIMLMTEALALSTSDLPKISGRVSAKPGSLDIFSATTGGAISQGVIGAAVGAVERAMRVLLEDGFDPTIYLTGGDAPKLLKCLDEEAEHCPHLVLQGLARILED